MTFEDELKEFCFLIEDYDGEVLDEVIQLKNKYCLDKQKVKDALYELLSLYQKFPANQAANILDLKIVIKELGLE